MMDQDGIIRVYSGSEVQALALQAELEEIGVGAMIRNDFQSGVMAGFVAGISAVVDLYISTADRDRAMPVVATFVKNC
jgi:hypothetical protein